MRAFVGFCAAALAAAQSSTMLFNQSEANAIYDGVGVSLHGADPSAATFSVGSSLNPPEFVEVFDATGALAWQYMPTAGAAYLVDSARHVDGASSNPVDTFAAECTAGGATLLGFSSTGTGTPAWSTALPNCTSDGGGGTYNGLQASDDGASVAFLCHATTAIAYLLDGQSGAIKWKLDLGPGVKLGQGSIEITNTGNFVLFVNEQGVPTPNTAMAYIIDASTGILRGNITIPFFITAAVSDSGDYVVVGDESVAHVWLWSASAGAYAPAYDITPPSGPRGWIPWDVVMSTGSDATEMIVLGCIAGDVLSVQVSAYALVGGALLTSWVSPINTKLQENPTLRADGAYIGVSLWGDSGETGYPTVVLLKAGSNTPLFSYVTPGSMFAVDLAVSSAAGSDTVLLTAAGKAVPANEFGNGGNAYAWSVVVPA